MSEIYMAQYSYSNFEWSNCILHGHMVVYNRATHSTLNFMLDNLLEEHLPSLHRKILVQQHNNHVCHLPIATLSFSLFANPFISKFINNVMIFYRRNYPSGPNDWSEMLQEVSSSLFYLVKLLTYDDVRGFLFFPRTFTKCIRVPPRFVWIVDAILYLNFI